MVLAWLDGVRWEGGGILVGGALGVCGASLWRCGVDGAL